MKSPKVAARLAKLAAEIAGDFQRQAAQPNE